MMLTRVVSHQILIISLAEKGSLATTQGTLHYFTGHHMFSSPPSHFG
jgi:hypothetical protein